MPRSFISKLNLLVLVICAVVQSGYSQRLSADEEARLGIRLIDDQEYSEGIKHLRYAISQDRKEFQYQLEMGRAFLLWQKPSKAEGILFGLIDHPDVTPELFVLLAESYDNLKRSKKAVEALERGLGKFPNSGWIHGELGLLRAAKGDGPMALAYWEKGIEVEPDFADNYRNASKFLSTQNNHLWTWLYGQAYLALTLAYGQPDVEAMNVVRKSLFSLFNMNKQTIPKQGLDAKFFGVLTPCAMGGADAETLAELEPKLKCFIESWSKDTDRSKNPVFDQLQQVLALDKLTEFMFWLYGETDREEMNAWGAEHAESFNEFSTWVFWNGIELDAEKPFNRLRN